MLQSIRDRATGPVVWGIILLLIVPFALWGIHSYFEAPANPTVAEVGGCGITGLVQRTPCREITKMELQRAYDQRYQRLQALLGENFRHDQVDPKEFKRGVLDEMVASALIEQYVARRGYRTGDAEVMSYLRSIPAFQSGGQFSPEIYRGALESQGLKPAAVEADIRKSLAVDQLRNGLLQTEFVTRRELDAAWRRAHQRRDLSYILVDAARFRNEINPTDAEISARYNAEKQRFMTPERVKLDYVELDKNAFSPAPAPDDNLLKTLYEAEKPSRYVRPEERRARHILFRVDAANPDDKALAKAKDAQGKLQKGADFAELAKQVSEDPGTRNAGGLLDQAPRGTLDPAFEDAEFRLKPGGVSQPVRTSFGWHLILVDQIVPAQTRPFTDPEVHTELLTLYRQRETDERFKQMADKLDELSFEHADSLQPIAQALKLQLQQTDWLTREGGAGLGRIKEVADAAFSESVIVDHVNSAVLKAGPDRLVVVRVREHEAPRQRTVAEVKDQLAGELREQGARRRAVQAGEQALKVVKQGGAADAAAAAAGVTLTHPGWIERSGSQVAPQIVAELFRLSKPAAGAVSVSGIEMADGGYCVVVLHGIEDGDPAKAGDAERKSLEQSLGGRLASAEFEAFKQALAKDVRVKVYEDQIN